MVISKSALVKVGTKSYLWYKDKGYIFKCGETIEVNINDLTEYSSAIVEVQCQNCKNIVQKKYFDYKYVVNTSNDNKYYCKKCSYENIKNTNLKRYGYICPLQNEEIIHKSKVTLLKNYGVDNISKIDSIKEDRSYLMKENTDNYNILINKKYGCNVSKLNWVKEKKKQTMIENWGVENPSQSPEIFEKSQKSGKKLKLHRIGLYYRGTYESHFLDFCLLNSIKVEKGPTIKYFVNNKERYYHSDFYIRNYNLVIEIKSNYYFDKFFTNNKLKEEYTIKNGYRFLFVINKDYTHFEELLLEK